MKRLNYIAILIFSFLACSKEIPEEKPILKITIFDATTWAINSTNTPVKDALVKIFNNSESYQQTTDQDGNVFFNDLIIGKNYYIITEKEDFSNLFQTISNNNEIAGLVTDGIFKSQKEIDSRIFVLNSKGDTAFAQPHVKVGDIRFSDINSDGIINSLDKTYGMPYKYLRYKDVNKDNIIDIYDKVQGNYIKLDTIEVEVWIGK